MSNKRPLSPELNNGLNHDNTRSLKRLKLHSIIQELRNEEANLAILKKLRLCQQLAARTNNTSTNGFHSVATRVPTNKTTLPIPPSRSSLQQLPPPLPMPSMPVATRKPTNSINPSLITKIPTSIPTKTPNSSTIYSLEERKTQAKKALRNQLERDLLNIPSPKPLLQDILFIPNPTSLEFQPYVGFEDVVQCLYELQNDRHRLPQRFTDRAQIDEPYICEHCGTDFTIRWWKHFNTNNSLNQQINILCDRCKKQVTRRTLKSDHSTLLKNVFVSAMEQEKEIEKTFHTLIKQQQKTTSRSSSSSSSKTIPNNRPIPSPIPAQIQSMTSIPTYNHQKPKTKSSIPQAQNFATKLSQQSASPITAARKSNVIVQPQINSTNNIRSIQHHKSPMPAHHHLPQQYRSATALPQHHSKNNQMVKMPKTAVRQQPVVSSRPLYPPPPGGIIPTTTIHPQISSSSSNNIRPTATKRRTLPSVNMK
jgi:hypothetical protein